MGATAFAPYLARERVVGSGAYPVVWRRAGTANLHGAGGWVSISSRPDDRGRLRNKIDFQRPLAASHCRNPLPRREGGGYSCARVEPGP